MVWYGMVWYGMVCMHKRNLNVKDFLFFFWNVVAFSVSWWEEEAWRSFVVSLLASHSRKALQNRERPALLSVSPPAPPPKAHGLALGSSSYFVFLLIASSPPFGQTMLNYLPFPLDKETCPPAALCPLRGVWMGWDSSFFFLHSYLRAILLSSLCCDGINAGYHSTMALMVTHPFFRNLWCSLKGCTPYSHGRRGQLQWDNRMYSLFVFMHQLISFNILNVGDAYIDSLS